MTKRGLKASVDKALKESSFAKDIKRISLFGSYLSGTPRRDSDIDLLIEFSPKARIGLLALMAIKEDLERLIGKEVDLLTPEALSKYFKKEVLSQAEILYER